MRILYIATEPPLPTINGVRIPLFNSMRLMREKGHELGLIVATPDGSDLGASVLLSKKELSLAFAHLRHIPRKSFAKVALKSVGMWKLFFQERYWCKHVAQFIADKVDQFRPDAVHFDLIATAEYRKVIPRKYHCVLSLNDSYTLDISERLRAGNLTTIERSRKLYELHASKRIERRLCNQFDAVHVVSNYDRSALSGIGVRSNVMVVSNGVDATLSEVAKHSLGNREAIFVGAIKGVKLAYVELLLRTIWPMVRKQQPSATLTFVGGVGSDGEVVAREIDASPGVNRVGYVQDLKDVYKLGGISVVPIDKSNGIINKAIEGMAAGHAVVGYESTFSGVPEARSGVNCLACKTDREFADSIARLIADAGFLKSVQVNAANLMRLRYSWESRSAEFEKMYFAC